jgi:hypothetical protein
MKTKYSFKIMDADFQKFRRVSLPAGALDRRSVDSARSPRHDKPGMRLSAPWL